MDKIGVLFKVNRLVVVVDRCKLDGPISYELVTIEKIIQVLKN